MRPLPSASGTPHSSKPAAIARARSIHGLIFIPADAAAASTAASTSGESRSDFCVYTFRVTPS